MAVGTTAAVSTNARLDSTTILSSLSASYPIFSSSAASAPAASLEPPVAYDARDTYPGQTPCKAFDVVNQGECNGCYTFSTAAAFSARVCREYPGVGNVALSAQQLLDCTSGCADGGSELYAYQSLVAMPDVENWCDPFTSLPRTCGQVCSSANSFGALPGSVQQVGSSGAFGVLQMQLELVRGGPGVVAFNVWSDLFSYGGGVYTLSATAVLVGGHAVSLVGWGVDQGVPYWICQNSWGTDWGESGFFRIVRGMDMCGIESTAGLVVAKPAPPVGCLRSNCSAGSTTLKDCSCLCQAGRSGPTCSVCTLACLNGGIRDPACTKCSCPPGFFGPVCEGGYSLGPLASCALDDSSVIRINFTFSGSVSPPTQASFIGVYALSVTNPFQNFAAAYICGSSYNATANRGLCPSAGSLHIARPSNPGQYQIVVVPYSPPNALGQSG